MLFALASLVVIGYLPGALIYRLPLADRPRRAALRFEERLFWAVVLSSVITTLATLALAAVGAYSLRRLVIADLAIVAVLVLAARGRLRYHPPAARPSWSVILPVVIVALGVGLYFPSSEYIMGGKDPGTYMNQGIQIAQGGSLSIDDATLAALPARFRPLFLTNMPERPGGGHHEGVRFMGFFVTDASRGAVMGQFPHAFPGWIAIAYGMDGLSGARRAVGLWAILGLLGVFFAGVRLLGPLPALAAASLLGVNVAQVWYARYPNSEVMQQALVFAGLLALARAYRDGDRFFGPVAAVLLGTLMFVRLDSLVILSAMAASLLLLVADRRTPAWSFFGPLSILLAVSGAYFARLLPAYLVIPLLQIGGARGLIGGLCVLVAAGALTRWVTSHQPAAMASLQRWVPRVLAGIVLVLAGYAYFLREPGGLLAAHDAYALRVFSWYVGSLGLLAAVVGFVAITWTRFWKDPVLLATGAAVCVLFFYKIRIVPENFWQARRYLAVILPFTCLMMAGCALLARRRRPEGGPPARQVSTIVRGAPARIAVCSAALAAVAWTFAQTTRPILRHVEYAGLIPAIERLAAQFGDRDLVLVEPRSSSDSHVLATPLAYIYARNVLLFSTPRPDRTEIDSFLAWAAQSYDRVWLVAEGGIDLASPSIGVTPVRNERFEIPEYESARNAYPREVRRKKFNLNIYQLKQASHALPVREIDVGGFDDVWVLRMFARQDQDGVTYRWIRDRSFITLVGLDRLARRLIFRAADGGRPEAAGPARVEVFLNDVPVGAFGVRGGFAEYHVDLPPDAVSAAASSASPTVVRLQSTTWTPKAFLGGSDDRELGVMLDRIRIE